MTIIICCQFNYDICQKNFLIKRLTLNKSVKREFLTTDLVRTTMKNK